MKLFHTLGYGYTPCIVTMHSPTPSICFHRGLRQGSTVSVVLYLLLLEPLLRSLASKAQADTCHAMPPLVPGYCDDLLLIVHTLLQILKYATVMGRYLAGIGMSLNGRKCAYPTTARIPLIIVHLDLDNAAAPCVYLVAKAEVPYLGLMLDPKGMASMKENRMFHCKALLGWCKDTLGPALVPHEVMAAVVGGMVPYAAPYMSDVAAQVVRLNAAMNTTAVHLENLPKDLSHVGVWSSKGLKLADVEVLCRDSMVAIVDQLTHHRSAVVKGELRVLLDNLHAQYRVHGQLMVPSEAFASHAGDTWIDRVLKAMGTLGVSLLMPSLVYSCAHAPSPQVQSAGRRWATRSYTFKGRDIYVLSGSPPEVALRSMTDPANNVLYASLPCHVPGHWAAQLRDCREDHLHRPVTGVGPAILCHVWLTGLQAVFQLRLA